MLARYILLSVRVFSALDLLTLLFTDLQPLRMARPPIIRTPIPLVILPCTRLHPLVRHLDLVPGFHNKRFGRGRVCHVVATAPHRVGVVRGIGREVVPADVLGRVGLPRCGGLSVGLGFVAGGGLGW